MLLGHIGWHYLKSQPDGANIYTSAHSIELNALDLRASLPCAYDAPWITVARAVLPREFVLQSYTQARLLHHTQLADGVQSTNGVYTIDYLDLDHDRPRLAIVALAGLMARAAVETARLESRLPCIASRA